MWSAAIVSLCVLACSARAPPGAGGYCDTLFQDLLKPRAGGEDVPEPWAGGERALRVNGRELGVSLVWGSGPARAGAALLRALLAGALRYRHVSLARAPHRLVDLKRNVTYSPTVNYAEAVLVLSAAWAGEPDSTKCFTEAEDECGVAGPRLREYGASSIPARARLHARWPGDTNRTSLEVYQFLNATGAWNGSAPVYYPVEDEAALNGTLWELRLRAHAASLPLLPQKLPRAKLFQKLRSSDEAFLFLDYNMWAGYPDVRPVRPPRCVGDFDCREDLDPSEALRAVDQNLLTKSAPGLYNTFHDFRPTPQSLREILEGEEEAGSVEEAACRWAVNNAVSFAQMRNSTKSIPTVYNEIVILCKDRDQKPYYDLMNSTYEIKLKAELNYSFGIDPLLINCDNPKAAIAAAENYMSRQSSKTAIGMVARGEVEAAALVAFCARHRLPLVLYSAPTDDIDANDTRHAAAWSSAGRLRPLARAVRRLAALQGWTRLAVLSDDSPLARNFFDGLNEATGEDHLALGDFTVPPDTSESAVTALLDTLRYKNARIVLVNARADAAAAILEAAGEAGMMREGYAWMVREWPPETNATDVRVISISHWCHSGEAGGAGGEGSSELRTEMDRLWARRDWPPRALALADAVLTLAYGFEEVMRRQTSIVANDIHTKSTIAEFKKVMTEGLPQPGVLQALRYEASTRARARSLVFVAMWSGAEHVPLGRCVVEGERVECNLSQVYPDGAPADGTSRCILYSGGDAFAPSCYDVAWICALVAVALAPATCWLARRAVLRRLARRDRHLLLLLLARRERAAEALGAHLVPRAALELREELGAGSFGRVRLALLRSGGRTRVVAAKSLREGAAPSEESEFLREACTLAALAHEHVVRLAGVCADDGPPLVLMEHAFFGDLLRYLRARRHLAEATPDGAEEAQHVAPEALTRLAREAASALGYLALRGLVHRDVRAANCLVDARRSLKLADFGMARETAAAGADGAAEYACRRRALFPVLWMAPESLARGVFSAASDVWALGVLLLELVTLGERPYGDMSPLRVLQFVAAGGRPPLPFDATPQTRGVALACWQRAAEQRPAAPELVTYLAAHPRALRAALHAPRLESAGHTDADSGYGEPASPDLLPPERCLALGGLDCALPR